MARSDLKGSKTDAIEMSELGARSKDDPSAPEEGSADSARQSSSKKVVVTAIDPSKSYVKPRMGGGDPANISSDFALLWYAATLSPDESLRRQKAANLLAQLVVVKVYDTQAVSRSSSGNAYAYGYGRPRLGSLDCVGEVRMPREHAPLALFGGDRNVGNDELKPYLTENEHLQLQAIATAHCKSA